MKNNRKPEKHSTAIIGHPVEENLSYEELRRRMYERIARGHALSTAEETARHRDR